MLKIPTKFSLLTPQTLAPVTLPIEDDDQDELMAAIADDHRLADNNWQLTDTPDVPELESFWSGVEQDLKNDPEWYSFADTLDDDPIH